MNKILTLEEASRHVVYDMETGIISRILKNGGIRPITTTDNDGYIVLKIGQKMYKGHRVAWLFSRGEWPTHGIDHENRIRSDNRSINLRPATVKQQNENRGVAKNSSSGVTGVCKFSRSGKWRAYIYHHKENIYLGQFDKFEDACAARKSAETRLFTHASRTPPLV